MSTPPAKKKVIVLCSGGMDSVTAIYAIISQGYEVALILSFYYGSKHNHKELPCAGWHANHLGIPHKLVDVSFINQLFKSNLLQSGDAVPEGHYADDVMKQTVVPFRNGILLSIAAGIAESNGAQGVVIGAHTGDHAIYPDCREEFMVSMANALRLGTYAGIELLRPLIDLDKGGIALLGKHLDVDYSHTWTCYAGGEKPCGKCGSCVERAEAFATAGFADPLLS